MAHDRCKINTRSLTFYDPKMASYNMLKNKKFFKFQEVFDLFKLNNKNCITPGSKLSVDETLYPFRGRFGALQFIKSKPARYGIKYWTIVDNRTNYVLDVNVYLGKNEQDVRKKDKLIGETKVLKLYEPFFDFESTRNCTFDNFFTSYSLMKTLYAHNITSTVRANKREIPLQFLNKKRFDVRNKIWFQQIVKNYWLLSETKKSCAIDVNRTPFKTYHAFERKQKRFP